jgi:hypothetical protein
VTRALASSSRPIRGEPPAEPILPAAPSARACDALEALKAEPLSVHAPSPLFAVLLAVLTLGAGPAILWTIRFHRAARQEREALRTLSDWAASHMRDPGARRPLYAALRCVRVRIIPSWFCVVFAIGALIIAVSGFFLFPDSREPSQLWIGSTYGFHWPRFDEPEWHYLRWRIFAGWTACLFTSYLLHLASVHLFARDVQSYLDAFNQEVAVEEGFAPVLREPIGWKSSPIWGLAAALLMTVSGWWGIPLAIAGMTDARYRRRASCRMRDDLADRVRSLIHLRPAYHDAEAVEIVRNAPPVRCATSGCDTVLLAKAKFCARCGARRGKAIDRRA